MSCKPRPSRHTGGWSPTGKRQHRRVVRVRHRGAHPTGPRRAKPRGRPQAPNACASLRQSPAPPQIIPPRSARRDPAGRRDRLRQNAPPRHAKARIDPMHRCAGAVRSLCRPSAPSNLDQRLSNLEEKLAQALDFSSVDARVRADPKVGLDFVGRSRGLGVSNRQKGHQNGPHCRNSEVPQ